MSRTFRGPRSGAKNARAALLTEVSAGRHAGAQATLDDLDGEWILELERKGRSPNTIYGHQKVYARNIKPTLGTKLVRKVTTKMLTDLYGEHQRRGLAPRIVYQIHACISSMLTQACRWEWRDTNPAQRAEPPAIPNVEPVVPTPDDVVRLIRDAAASRRPEYARALFVAATTGIRRAEVAGLRRNNLDLDRGILMVTRSIAEISGKPLRGADQEPTHRPVALDAATTAILAAQLAWVEEPPVCSA